MKQLSFILMLLIAAGITACEQQPAGNRQAVNPLLGDVSFIRQFGSPPTSETDEYLRIQTHLDYVGQLLRDKDVTHLTPELRKTRALMLQLLHDYRITGIFPKNYGYADKRMPCFIDREGRICAVGYLIEQTAGRAAAEAINSKYQYDELLAMHDPAIDDWIAGSGLTKEEAAMIQPTYGYVPPTNYNYIKPSYGTASAVLGGANLSVAAINGIQLARGSGHKAIPIIGMASGIAQIWLGAKNFPEEHPDWNGYGYTNESQKMLSMANIGLGTATIVLSAWNLLSQRKPADRRTTWGIHSFPTRGNNTGIACTVTRRF